MFSKLSTLEQKHQVMFATIIALSVVLIWRGLWGILDLYLLPSNPLLSYLVSTVAGILILMGTHRFVKTFVY